MSINVEKTVDDYTGGVAFVETTYDQFRFYVSERGYLNV